VWRQIPSTLANKAMDTMMYLQERYPEVLNSHNGDSDASDEDDPELEEGANMMETYTNMLTRVMAGIEAQTFNPPGINMRAVKRAGGFPANNEMGAAARAWARKWLVKRGSRGSSQQWQRKVAERTRSELTHHPQAHHPEAQHVSVGPSGWWGRVISLLVSLMPLWLVCWCQQMKVGTLV